MYAREATEMICQCYKMGMRLVIIVKRLKKAHPLFCCRECACVVDLLQD